MSMTGKNQMTSRSHWYLAEQYTVNSCRHRFGMGLVLEEDEIPGVRQAGKERMATVSCDYSRRQNLTGESF